MPIGKFWLEYVKGKLYFDSSFLEKMFILYNDNNENENDINEEYSKFIWYMENDF